MPHMQWMMFPPAAKQTRHVRRLRLSLYLQSGWLCRPKRAPKWNSGEWSSARTIPPSISPICGTIPTEPLPPWQKAAPCSSPRMLARPRSRSPNRRSEKIRSPRMLLPLPSRTAPRPKPHLSAYDAIIGPWIAARRMLPPRDIATKTAMKIMASIATYAALVLINSVSAYALNDVDTQCQPRFALLYFVAPATLEERSSMTREAVLAWERQVSSKYGSAFARFVHARDRQFGLQPCHPHLGSGPQH